MQVKGVPLIIKGIIPSFWRAPTENDKGGGSCSYLSVWKAAHIDNLSFTAERCSILSTTEHYVKIAVIFLGVRSDDRQASNSDLEKSNVLIQADMTYTIFGSGDVLVNCNVQPSPNLPPLPRVGVKFHLDKSMDRVKWYGRGPFECYPDRKAAAHVGVYEKNVSEMHVPYIVPGESSGRTDVRWVTFENKDGVGIYASIYGSSPPMQMRASYYSTAELERAVHNDDLVEGDDIEVDISEYLA